MSIVTNALCIPRIEITIPKSLIFNTFNNMNIGRIESIVEIPFKDMPKYKRVIIKLQWNESDRAKYMIRRFQEGKNVKIVYDMPSPWFWICVPNRLHCKFDIPPPPTNPPPPMGFNNTKSVSTLPIAPALLRPIGELTTITNNISP